ncbi:acylphosphatase [Robbsia sp. Bb-Pol-6]|uniref:acylphosphatase n=1 Tax=Robbsia betulipollinis TaxID=2981849 RepID=A0ABT3ZTX0_9BURK|nr:acylphosphatase [Robbsia betulipollinis]MCY0389655.1 acylphosphatase [Robbsia betulipollinis]
MSVSSHDSSLETHSIRVHGRVQGVGYRAAAVRQAHMIGVRGWVRNVEDGTVEAIVQGSPDQIDLMLEWMRRGPPAARVATLDCQREPDDRRFGHFEQR